MNRCTRLWRIWATAAILAAAGIGAGLPPAAALCQPEATVAVLAYGDAMPAAMLAYRMFSGSGAADLPFTGDSEVLRTAADRLAGKMDVYTNRWRSVAGATCAWAEHGLVVAVYDTSFEQLSFSDDLLKIAYPLALGDQLNFAATHRMHRRQGVRAEKRFAAGALVASVGVDAWRLVSWKEESIVASVDAAPYRFIAQIDAIDSGLRPPSLMGMPPFRGSGAALTASLTWDVAAGWRLAYHASPLVGAERMTAPRQRLRVDTSNQALGPDGYLRSRPMGEGFWELVERTMRVEPERLFEASWTSPEGWQFWVERRLAPAPDALRLGATTAVGGGASRLGVAWAPGARAISLDYSGKYGRAWLAADALSLEQARYFAGGVDLSWSY